MKESLIIRLKLPASNNNGSYEGSGRPWVQVLLLFQVPVLDKLHSKEKG
jgi:hypothetical protein